MKQYEQKMALSKIINPKAKAANVILAVVYIAVLSALFACAVYFSSIK